MPINKLNARTAKLIGSSVIISSVYSVVKELLENAIDAGATSVNISLEKYGHDRIEVRDNGSGICHADIPLACLSGHTSKIQDFSDIDHLQSYGFRGQALSALCTVSDLSFTTRTADDDVASTYSVDKEGRIVSSTPSHLGIGTTVVVKNLFINVPVRRKMLSKSPSSLRTILWLLRCYSIAKPSLVVSLVHNGSLVWRKCPAYALTSAIQEALGYKLAVMMHQMYYKESFSHSEVTTEEELGEEVEIEMDIVVPKKGSNISEFCSTQTVEGIILNEYLMINGRPVKHKKVEKLMTDCISKGLGSEFPNRKKPPWVLRINVPSPQLDVNLETDKTKVFLRCEDLILRTLEEKIITYYGIQIPGADTSSQSVEKKAAKKKPAVPNLNDELLDPPLSHSPEDVETDVRLITNSSLDRNHSIPSHPPPPKLARVELEKPDSRNPFDLNEDNINPSKIDQPFMSLEPFDLTDSQISEVGSSQEMENHEVVMDVSPLKRLASKSHIGSFQIEVIRKPEDITEEKNEVECDKSSEKEKSIAESVKPLKEVEGVNNKKSTDDKNGLSSEDDEVICDALKIMENLESEDELDPEKWSRGKVKMNGVLMEEPVKILPPKPNQQVSTERTSGLQSVASREVSSHPFEMRRKAEGKSSACSPSASDERVTPSCLSASPLPNAISQLGRRDMRGFDCFASKARPKIIAEQPGILFTNVASELAKRWEALSDEERVEYKKQGIEKAARKATAHSEQALERSLPKKIAHKLPGILSDKEKQETLLKRVVKEKHEISQQNNFGRSMSVSLAKIKEKNKKWEKLDSEEQLEKPADERIFLVGQLKPSGMWVYKKGSDIGILRHFALQELVVYQKLMASLSLPMQPLTVPIVFDEREIGSELWKKFISLGSHYDVIKQQSLVTSELLVKNGFQISLLPGDNDNDVSALITGITSAISPYGVEDLKEVLQKIDSSDVVLSKCRILPVSNYIESEAIRMCRQSPPVMPKHDVLSLLTQWDGRPKCLHSKPVLVPFDRMVLPDEAQLTAS
ncbi:PMS1 protein homolog 1-like [Ischnura elegans]|uniref:PMS1 protein homolog 1-like n=1 Tax=Ischnura elegans TaxID=197161 RepID=UPI001ED8A055|nr:PMS1 protein homolog 1-like [Ischnura elegans]